MKITQKLKDLTFNTKVLIYMFAGAVFTAMMVVGAVLGNQTEIAYMLSTGAGDYVPIIVDKYGNWTTWLFLTGLFGFIFSFLITTIKMRHITTLLVAQNDAIADGKSKVKTAKQLLDDEKSHKQSVERVSKHSQHLE